MQHTNTLKRCSICCWNFFQHHCVLCCWSRTRIRYYCESTQATHNKRNVIFSIDTHSMFIVCFKIWKFSYRYRHFVLMLVLRWERRFDWNNASNRRRCGWMGWIEECVLYSVLYEWILRISCIWQMFSILHLFNQKSNENENKNT